MPDELMVNLLFAASSAKELAAMKKAFQGESTRIFTSTSGEEAEKLITMEDIHIVIVSTTLEDVDAYELCRRIKKNRQETPIQVLLLSSVRDTHEIRRAVEAGSDDFLKTTYDVDELMARIKAATIRWQTQANLLKEREFYRVAVAEEERLSSLVLDQNRSLKEAYEKIRGLNEQLEKANRELEKIAAYDSLSSSATATR